MRFHWLHTLYGHNTPYTHVILYTARNWAGNLLHSDRVLIGFDFWFSCDDNINHSPDIVSSLRFLNEYFVQYYFFDLFNWFKTCSFGFGFIIGGKSTHLYVGQLEFNIFILIQYVGSVSHCQIGKSKNRLKSQHFHQWNSLGSVTSHMNRVLRAF